MINTIMNQIRNGMENGSISYDGLKDMIAQLSEIRKEKAKAEKKINSK